MAESAYAAMQKLKQNLSSLKELDVLACQCCCCQYPAVHIDGVTAPEITPSSNQYIRQNILLE